MPALRTQHPGFRFMDPLPIFLTAISIFVGTAILQYRITVSLAKWLHLHHRETWEEFGRPGTTFFKGDEDNRYFTRTLAMSGLSRRMMQGDVKMLPRGEAVEAMLRQYRCLDRISTTTFVLIGA
jgi:hypothetical protein